MDKCTACHREFPGGEPRCPHCGYRPDTGGVEPLFSRNADDETPGFRVEHFDLLEDAEAGHFWFDARNAVITWALGHYFPDTKRFLEVGCGTGHVLAAIRRQRPSVDITGTELFAEGLNVARRRLQDVAFLRADARRLPFVAGYDVAGAFDVLEHVDQDEQMLKELFVALRPGGGLLVTVPQHMFLWSANDVYACHRRRYSRPQLIAKLERAGFRVIRTTSFTSLLFPVMWLSRRLRSKRADPLAELKIHPVINACFARVLDLERFCIRLGVSWPVGGSLLAVAQRD